MAMNGMEQNKVEGDREGGRGAGAKNVFECSVCTSREQSGVGRCRGRT